MLRVRRALARAWLVKDDQRVQGWALQEPKTPRSRWSVNLPTIAVRALEARQAAQRDGRRAAGTTWQDADNLVITDALGRPLRGYDIGHAFPAMLESAGVSRIPFHGLRHSAATALLAAGVPLRTVADVLGHSTITITADPYAAVVPELRRDAADAMDRVWGSWAWGGCGPRCSREGHRGLGETLSRGAHRLGAGD
jgi:integrase